MKRLLIEGTSRLQLDKHLNYAIGDDESKWASDVPVFRQIEYQEPI